MFKIAFHPIYVHPVPKNHRFPMEKYELLPLQLVHEGIVEESNFFEPTMEHIYDYSIHNNNYLKKLFNGELTKTEERASGFKQDNRLVQREICITNGTIEAAMQALNDGISFNIAGGTHHAFSNKPEGFCLLNDQAIASMHLLNNSLVKKIIIIDLDVHQGNGTAEILSNEPRVYTFSMHGEKNYPLHKPASDLDISIPDSTNDLDYLTILEKNLKEIFNRFQPEFAFYQSGVDVLKSDKLGRLSLTLEGCKKRDEFVFNICKENSIPVTTTMGGGYSKDIKIILDAHCNTFKAGISKHLEA
ncbi:MAG: histone deacetylase [Flavobacteriales bacterium]|nr:histone deacetylase [Flavobacteriales bacterium]MBO72256.1 histone deacetylase [Flavobacteriales bacterium]|tara:strand:- start:3994 stop:4899 length:906 start_codon:yes stop_codon:yes gene_type:complete